MMNDKYKYIYFFIQGDPPTCTAQERRIVWSKKMTYLPQAVKEAKAHYYAAAIPYAPAEPFDDAVELELHFHFYQKNGKVGKCKTTKPDCDNLAKLLTDSLAEAGFFVNDSRIARLTVTKDFVEQENAGVEVLMKRLNEDKEDIPFYLIQPFNPVNAEVAAARLMNEEEFD